MTTSAWRRDGATKLSKAGLTKRVYCSMTPDTSLPRTDTSRLIRRARRTSSSVSTNTFMSHSSRIRRMCSTRMPSITITSAGFTRTVSSALWCVVKS